MSAVSSTDVLGRFFGQGRWMETNYRRAPCLRNDICRDNLSIDQGTSFRFP